MRKVVASWLACAVSFCAVAAPDQTKQTFTFDGGPAPKWDAVETGSVDDADGVLRLSSDFAVGAAVIDDNKLPSYNAAQEDLVRSLATATGVTLDWNAYLLHSVTLRAVCADGATTTATFRVYGPERDSDKPTVEAILDREGGGKDPQELPDAVVSGAVTLALSIEDGKTEFKVTDAAGTPILPTCTLGSGATSEFTAFRLELSGNGPEGVRPSVKKLVLELKVQDK